MFTQMFPPRDMEEKINCNYQVMKDELLRLLKVTNLLIHMTKVYIWKKNVSYWIQKEEITVIFVLNFMLFITWYELFLIKNLESVDTYLGTFLLFLSILGTAQHTIPLSFVVNEILLNTLSHYSLQNVFYEVLLYFLHLISFFQHHYLLFCIAFCFVFTKLE